MQMSIETYGKQYETELEPLLQRFDEDLWNQFKAGQLENIFIAIRKNQLAGALVTWKSKYHPNCTYFRIITAPSFSAQATVERLFEKLEEMRTNAVPLVTSHWEKANAFTRFYLQKGFEIIRKTYMPTLNLANIKAHNFESNEKYRLCTVADIHENDFILKELLRLVKGNYEQSHEVNPVAKLSLNQWRDLTFSDNLIREGSFLFLMENRIIAYSFLHKSTEENMLEIGWVGALESGYKKELVSLVHRQLEYVREIGFKSISGEFDTTDEYAMTVLESFPFTPTPAWLTLKKQ